MLNRGVDNVLDDCIDRVHIFFAVVDMLHMFPYAQQGGLITFFKAPPWGTTWQGPSPRWFLEPPLGTTTLLEPKWFLELVLGKTRFK